MVIPENINNKVMQFSLILLKRITKYIRKIKKYILKIKNYKIGWKQIGRGGTSVVYLSKDKKIVQKRYNINSTWLKYGNMYQLYEREKLVLGTLSGKPHFPILYDYDDKNKILYMSYCGERMTKANCPPNYMEQLEQITELLKKNNIIYRDFRSKNITVKEGTVYLVDFGQAFVRHYPYKDLNEHCKNIIASEITVNSWYW